MKRVHRLRQSIIGMSIAAVFVVIMIMIVTRPPQWYAPPDAADPRVAARAGDVEYDLAVELQQVRAADAPWSLSISETDLNAWLAVRLPDWWVQQGHGEWPHGIGAPQVRMEGGGRFALALPVDRGGMTAIVHAKGSIELIDGALILRVDGTGLGYAPLPRTLVSRLSGLSADNVASELLAGLFSDGIELEPVITLADRRRVRATALRTEDGHAIWTLRTEPRDADTAHDADDGVTAGD